MEFSPVSCPFLPLRSKYSPQHPVLKLRSDVRNPASHRNNFTLYLLGSFKRKKGQNNQITLKPELFHAPFLYLSTQKEKG